MSDFTSSHNSTVSDDAEAAAWAAVSADSQSRARTPGRLLPDDTDYLREFIRAHASKRMTFLTLVGALVATLATLLTITLVVDALRGHNMTAGRLWVHLSTCVAATIIVVIAVWLVRLHGRQVKAAESLADRAIEQAWLYTVDSLFNYLLYKVTDRSCTVDEAVGLWRQVPSRLCIGYGDGEILVDVKYMHPKERADMCKVLKVLDELDREALLEGLDDEEAALIVAVVPALTQYVIAGCPGS